MQVWLTVNGDYSRDEVERYDAELEAYTVGEAGGLNIV